MRINEIILTESQNLEEGPMLDKAGTLVGKAVGGVAKGVGAVAGGIAGLGSAFKKGYRGGKATVAGDPNPNPEDPPETSGGGAAATPAASGAAAPAATPAASGAAAPAASSQQFAPAGGAAPAATAPGGGAGEQPAAKDVNAAGPKGTAPAANLTGAAKTAADKTAAVTQDQNATQASQTVYAQVKANIDKLDKKGKQRILQLLQKSIATPVKDPAAKPAAAGGVAPAADAAKSAEAPATDAAADTTAKPAAAPATDAAAAPVGGAAPPADATAAPANTMANAPVSATNTAAADNPNQPQTKKTGGKVKGQVSQTPGAVAKRAKRQAAASANSTGNKVMGNMANQLTQQNASKTNYGNALSEALAARVEQHRRDIFETDLRTGKTSIFKK